MIKEEIKKLNEGIEDFVTTDDFEDYLKKNDYQISSNRIKKTSTGFEANLKQTPNKSDFTQVGNNNFVRLSFKDINNSKITKGKFKYTKIYKETAMKKSELRKMIKEELMKEAVDPILQKIGDIAKNKDLVSMRGDLEKIFGKKNVDFTFSGAPHFRIKYKNRIIVVVNKKYVDGAELIVGPVAIGFQGK